MSETQLLTSLITWFSEQCNGVWEHGSGIRIETIDNPGWMVKVYLRQTPLENTIFEPVTIQKSEDDWLNCYKKDSIFIGAGDLWKLATILEVFLDFTRK